MKVILRQDVPKLGEAGTIHEVANGFGRNYLIPQGMAILATPGEVKVAEHNLGVKARKVAKQEAQLQALADKIDGQRLSFTARAGDQGRLFGSITGGDIAEELAKAVGEEVDRRKVVLAEPLRTVGEHKVVVHLVGRLRPTVTVAVVGELEDGTLLTAIPTAPAPAAEDAGESGTTGERGRAQGRDQDRTPGAAGHPEPGSQHDDSKLETVDDGPATPEGDGVPGADGEGGGETTGGAVGETLMEGKAAEVTLDR